LASDTVSLIEKEKKLSTYEEEDRIVKSTEIQNLLTTQKDPFSFKSKLPAMDKWLEDLEAGELVVVSGLTGQGKTTLCQTLSFNFFTQDIASLWFSYEMTYRQFLRKLPDDLFVYMPLVLKGKSIDWLRDRIHEAKIKYGVRAVFIDHLHFLVDMAKIKNPSLEIGSIVRGLKRIALDLNVTIFLIAHSTKIKFDEEPELDSIRDSSFIPQDSDIVLIVWRAKDKAGEFTSKTIVKVAKSRRTGIMGKKVVLTYTHGVYYEEAIND
jgi:Replicative DNA helicase